MSLPTISLVLVLFFTAFSLSLMWVYRTIKVKQEALGKILKNMNDQRLMWLKPWEDTLNNAHKTNPTTQTKNATIALAVLHANMSSASMDWGYSPSTDLLLKNEWRFEEALEGYIYVDHKDLKEQWEKDLLKWNSVRYVINQQGHSLNQTLNSPLGQIVQRIIFCPQPTTWMDKTQSRNTNILLSQILQQNQFQ